VPPLAALSVGLALFAAAPRCVSAEPIQSGPRDLRLIPGQVIDGWTGLPIPCRCLYQAKVFKLGDIVCMRTHVGIVMTRCELFLNHTAWMPTSEPCTISGSPPQPVASLPRTIEWSAEPKN
jgi:hypothetical protein